MAVRVGKFTLLTENSPGILAAAAVGGKKESEGPMGEWLDEKNTGSRFGQDSWESAESFLQRRALTLALRKADVTEEELSVIFAGDLLNQCAASTFALRETGIPMVGLYGACSTMAEGLAAAALFTETGLAHYAAAVTSSHFCSAERQFRFPLEYGGQRTPTAQWTATAAGAAIVAQTRKPPYLRAVTWGRIVDAGITDPSNMGAAMAPAAADTLCRFFRDTGKTPKDFTLILTGDLGAVGSSLLRRLTEAEGFPLEGRHADCGLMLFDRNSHPQMGAGGSGCGCSAAVVCGYLAQEMACGRLRDVLFTATGALISPTASLQGESIPGIAHLVWLSARSGEEGSGWRS